VTSDLRLRLAAIFADVFQVAIDPEADVRRENLDAWDSVNHFRLVMEIEQAFGISLSDDEVTDLMSLRDVEALVARRLSGPGGAA
jgi:acyl carrier protein